MTEAPAKPVARILVVDDIEANLRAMRSVLRKVDAEIVEARNGNDALRQTLDHEFAVILLDVQMPEMDGYEVADILRGAERTENTPIIFVTATHDDLLERLKGYNVGAVDFITKPLDSEVLRSKVAFFVEYHRSRQALVEKVAEAQRLNERLLAEVHARLDAEENLQRTIAELERARSVLAADVLEPLNALRKVAESARLEEVTADDAGLRERISGVVERGDRAIAALESVLPPAGDAS